MKLYEVHEDMRRYLADDCYCPNEIYGVDGFFYQLFPPETEVAIVEQTADMSVVVDATPDVEMPRLLVFWHDDDDRPGRILNARMVDATENNAALLKAIVKGEDTGGRMLDEFNPGSTAKALDKVFSMCDAVMVS